MLTGPLYKLQVYDSLLSSRSLAIVLVLAAWIAFLCMITEIRDYCRTWRMARSGKGFPQALEKPFLDAAMGASLSPQMTKKAAPGCGTAMPYSDGCPHPP